MTMKIDLGAEGSVAAEASADAGHGLGGGALGRRTGARHRLRLRVFFSHPPTPCSYMNAVGQRTR